MEEEIEAPLREAIEFLAKNELLSEQLEGIWTDGVRGSAQLKI